MLKRKLCLAVTRTVLWFMLLWAFFDKLLGLGIPTNIEAIIINDGSSTGYCLSEVTSCFLKSLFRGLIGNTVLNFVLMSGLIVMGVALMLRFASRPSAYAP